MKEIRTRFDFKGTKTEIVLNEEELELSAVEEYPVKSALEVLETKLVKRGVSLKALQPGKIESALGSTFRQRIPFQQGIPIEKARKIVKMVKGTKRKVQASIQGEQVRISSKKKDDLQEIMQLLRDSNLDIDMQFENYR